MMLHSQPNDVYVVENSTLHSIKCHSDDTSYQLTSKRYGLQDQAEKYKGINDWCYRALNEIHDQASANCSISLGALDSCNTLTLEKLQGGCIIKRLPSLGGIKLSNL